MRKLAGVLTAMVTPFRNDSVDEEGFIQNIHHQLEAGVNGLVVLGTTGEAPTLTDAERDQLIRCAVKVAGGRVPVIVGCGDPATHRAIAKLRRAEELGADLALVVTPYYNRPTQEGLFQHYQALATSCALPIICYNVPVRTGVNLEPATIRRLFAFPSIVGVKEEFAQVSAVMRLKLQERPDFAVFSGNDGTALPEIALGAQGVISAVSNLLPAEIVQLTNAVLEGHYDEARAWHYRLLPLFQAAFIETNPAPIKAAMVHFGMPAGACRLPLTALRPESWMVLEQALRAWSPVASARGSL